MRQMLLGLAIGLTLLTFIVLSGSPKGPQSQEVGSTGEAAVGGAFTLTDTAGKAVTEADFEGRIALVFFGFTNCPDICPVTLQTFTQLLEKLGDKSEQVAPVFITVDPARDTPQAMKEYIAKFDERIIGLTGTPEQVEAAASAYKAYYAKAGGEPVAGTAGDGSHAHGDAHGDHDDAAGGNYMVNHSGFVYVMGRDGKYITHLSYDAPEDEIIAAITPYLE